MVCLIPVAILSLMNLQSAWANPVSKFPRLSSGVWLTEARNGANDFIDDEETALKHIKTAFEIGINVSLPFYRLHP